METGRKIPQHIAIILDGNGRWAKAKGMPRNYGHTAGAKNVETVCQAAHDLGVKYVTMYAFSTENWNRPEGEVEALMKLLESYLKNCIKTADKNNMRVRVIGDTTRLSERFQERIRELEAASAKNDGLNLQIAINYGSRDNTRRPIAWTKEKPTRGFTSGTPWLKMPSRAEEINLEADKSAYKSIIGRFMVYLPAFKPKFSRNRQRRSPRNRQKLRRKIRFR